MSGTILESGKPDKGLALLDLAFCLGEKARESIRINKQDFQVEINAMETRKQSGLVSLGTGTTLD